MPDIRKVEDSLIGHPKVKIAKAELDGGNQGYESNEYKVDNGNYLCGAVIAQFLKLYV